MRELIRKHAGVDLQYEDVVEFDYCACPDRTGRCLTKTEWQAVYLEFTAHHLDRIEPFEGIQTHLAKLGEYFEIHLATSRLPEGRDATRRWLETHVIPCDEVHFVSHREKQKIPESFLAAVDDDRDQARLFLQRGVRPFLLAHPWNRVASDIGILRVANWIELADSLIHMAET